MLQTITTKRKRIKKKINHTHARAHTHTHKHTYTHTHRETDTLIKKYMHTDACACTHTGRQRERILCPSAVPSSSRDHTVPTVSSCPVPALRVSLSHTLFPSPLARPLLSGSVCLTPCPAPALRVSLSHTLPGPCSQGQSVSHPLSVSSDEHTCDHARR